MTRSLLGAPPGNPLLLAVPLTFALGVALVGVAAVPASASVASVQWDGTQLTYQAIDGETNNVTITQTGPGTFTITDSGATITAGQNCTVAGGTATCTSANASNVQVTLGDGDDTASVDTTIQTQIYGEAGNDTLTAVSGPSYLHGGAGDDDLVGSPSTDVIYPGVGADQVTAGDGNDAVYGEPTDGLTDAGNDTIHMGAGNDSVSPRAGNQQINGGPGIDTVSYGYSFWSGGTDPDVAVSLDGVANDGNPTLAEHDNIDADVETVSTGSGNDVLVGSDGANTLSSGFGNDVVDGAGGRDRLLGGPGDDTLLGGAGEDRLIGETGADAYDGGDGDDYLDASDIAGADTFNGGTGVDFVAFTRDNDVSVTMMDGLPNDGEAGEGDNVMADVEDVVTGAGNDRIIGSMASNDLSGGAGNDIIRALGGNDGLDGALGRDRLLSGRGIDSISGGGNVDTITSQDSSADYVTCGSSIDSLDHDRHDQVGVDCETLS